MHEQKQRNTEAKKLLKKLKQMGFIQSAIAEACGFKSQGSISQIRSGVANVTEEKLIRIKDFYNEQIRARH